MKISKEQVECVVNEECLFIPYLPFIRLDVDRVEKISDGEHEITIRYYLKPTTGNNSYIVDVKFNVLGVDDHEEHITGDECIKKEPVFLIEEHHELHTYASKGEVKVKCTLGDEYEVVTIRAGEPEDNSFGRDLSGAFNISKLVEFAFKAGQKNARLVHNLTEEIDEDDW